MIFSFKGPLYFLCNACTVLTSQNKMVISREVNNYRKYFQVDFSHTLIKPGVKSSEKVYQERGTNSLFEMVEVEAEEASRRDFMSAIRRVCSLPFIKYLR